MDEQFDQTSSIQATYSITRSIENKSCLVLTLGATSNQSWIKHPNQSAWSSGESRCLPWCPAAPQSCDATVPYVYLTWESGSSQTETWRLHWRSVVSKSDQNWIISNDCFLHRTTRLITGFMFIITKPDRVFFFFFLIGLFLVLPTQTSTPVTSEKL